MIQEGARECKYRQVQKSNGMDAKKKAGGQMQQQVTFKADSNSPKTA
jgi:hypothetical protein